MVLDKRKTTYAIFIGILGATGPFIFWRIFLQQLPVTGIGEATLSTRFIEDDDSEDEVSHEDQARLRELLPYPATALFLDEHRESLNMYEQGTGRAFSVHAATLTVFPLSEEKLKDFSDARWSPNGKEVIGSYATENGTEYRYFDYDSQRVSPLPPTTTLIAFSPDGQSIVTVRKLHDTSELWISKPDGTEDWLLMATRAQISHIWWPGSDFVAMQTMRPNGKESLTRVGLNAELELLLENQIALDVLWSRNGEVALISSEDEGGSLSLNVFHPASRQLTSLGLNAQASHCAWHRQARGLTCGIKDGSTTSRDTVVTIHTDGTGLITRYQAPEDVWIGLMKPISLPRDNGIAFINVFDNRPYILTW